MVTGIDQEKIAFPLYCMGMKFKQQQQQQRTVTSRLNIKKIKWGLK